ncbi:MAG: dihydroorotate dehydrogenase [Clostridia bacterium]|nr:dihydroorotate dehydrogenase [Clostridia bacterium]
MNTAVEIAGVKFKNPVITASGTFGFGKEYNELYPVSALGGICTKGLTIKEREGNASPRVAETPSGMLNSVGLQNPGVEYYLKEYDGWLSGIGTTVIANIAGSKLEDYVAIASRINDSNADMVELNISCPNVRSGGIAFGVQPDSVRRVTEAVKKVCVKPVITKLTPNVSCIADNAKAAEDGGADAISLINTITGMAVDYKRRRPILANNTGGLSGPCVKPIALRMVWECYNAVKIPIIGLGGITSYTDVLEFMICGARAVQVGTANISDPYAAYTIVRDLEEYCKASDLDINTLVGTLQLN